MTDENVAAEDGEMGEEDAAGGGGKKKLILFGAIGPGGSARRWRRGLLLLV
jgi:hypothetical protein